MSRYDHDIEARLAESRELGRRMEAAGQGVVRGLRMAAKAMRARRKAEVAAASAPNRG